MRPISETDFGQWASVGGLRCADPPYGIFEQRRLVKQTLGTVNRESGIVAGDSEPEL